MFYRYVTPWIAAGLMLGCSGPTPDATNAARPARAAADANRLDASLFDLTSVWRNASGNSVQLRDLSGHVSIVTMVYTSCQATCPLIMADLGRVESQFTDEQRAHIRFVLVSLDPDRDTPGRLLEWARERQLDTDRWWLLAGTDDAVRELAASLDIRYQRQDDGEFAHTNGTTVLDASGRVVFRHAGLGGVPEIVAAARTAIAPISP